MGEASTVESGASLKWLLANISKAVGKFVLRHYVWSVLILLALFLLREEWQPWAVLARRYAAPIALSAGIVWLGWVISLRRSHWYSRLGVLLLAFGLVAGCVTMYEYFSLFVRYQSFNVEVIDTIPETDHERMQPLKSVHALAQGVTGDSRNPAPPDFVWTRNRKTGTTEYRWTMGVEPKVWIDKIFGSVDEVINVSGTDPSADMTPPESKVKVHFTVGESLWLSSHAATAAIRSFDPLMFFSYEPTDVRYLEDNNGEMVEVISLLRWRGIIFPYPEFGGVLLIHQSRPESPQALVEAYARRVLFGAGEWVSPERIQDFGYLRGQNILPYRVSRYAAESLRFMNGFWAPFPSWHQGDVRIPDPGENLNEQPYATFFKATNGLPGMLYHYFSLEPYLAGNHGLVASVLIPADGTSRLLVYQHEKRDESLIGVSMVPGFVRNSKKNYDWDKSAPVEERPYVRYVNGKRHLLWLTTVVTYKDVKKDAFVAGGIPEVALVDAGGTHEVVWVDPRDPEGWVKLLSAK